MEMFKEGGLKDEGGTKDPVSGNDVPSGSLKEEVRDDIDAKLSPGEFVFPADVVRFIGLQKLMQMRDKAKAGLQRMEDMGQMGNSDEAIIDDDVPFGTTDLIIMAGPSDNEMNQGGMPTVPGQGRFDQIVGQPQFDYEVKKFRNEAGAELFIPFVRGEPVYQAPPGYSEVSQEQQQQELADPTLPQATVESELGQTGTDSGMGGGPSVGDVGYSDMTDTEKADFGDAARGVGPAGAFGKAAIGFGSGMLDMTGGMISAGPLGKAAEFGVEALTGEKSASKTLGAMKNAQIEDSISRSKARELMSPIAGPPGILDPLIAMSLSLCVGTLAVSTLADVPVGCIALVLFSGVSNIKPCSNGVTGFNSPVKLSLDTRTLRTSCVVGLKYCRKFDPNS